MNHTAPKPPSRLSLLWIGLAGGATICVWSLMAAVHFTSDGGIAHDRLPLYIAVGLSGLVATAWLGAHHVVQKTRRDAWWEGFAAGDEPLAEVIPLRDVKGYEGSVRKFVVSSPR